MASFTAWTGVGLHRLPLLNQAALGMDFDQLKKAMKPTFLPTFPPTYLLTYTYLPTST